MKLNFFIGCVDLHHCNTKKNVFDHENKVDIEGGWHEVAAHHMDLEGQCQMCQVAQAFQLIFKRQAHTDKWHEEMTARCAKQAEGFLGFFNLTWWTK